MKHIVGICVGVVLAALLVFAAWAIRVEITYRENVRAMMEHYKRAHAHVSPNKAALQNNRPCRFGEKCEGDRDALR
jgi:hypothetical protein